MMAQLQVASATTCVSNAPTLSDSDRRNSANWQFYSELSSCPLGYDDVRSIPSVTAPVVRAFEVQKGGGDQIAQEPMCSPGDKFLPKGTTVYGSDGRSLGSLTNDMCEATTAHTIPELNNLRVLPGDRYVANTLGTSVAGDSINPRHPEGILTCEKWQDWVGFRCFGRMLSVFIGTALITLTAWLLAATGYLFNLLVDHTVVQFGNLLISGGVKQAIDTGWTAIRDVANIVIIAMFVFISINIILGVKEFGEKKFIARVLIIAVLINFSLLFTKVIIDAANFAASQFVTASGFASRENDTRGVSLTTTGFIQKGIAGEFIKAAGLSSAGDAAQKLTAAAFGTKDNAYSTADGWTALLHGVVIATLFFTAAAIIFYASFLLVARAVLLIFLMMTSALAFASWLVPQQFMENAWWKWWNSLLKSALFAPILMIFLWASLNVARALPQKGTLGSMIANPSNTLSLEALLNYLIVIGLLFVSVVAANAFSKTISGFRFAKMGVGFGTLTPLAGASRMLGLAGRGTIGAAAGGAYKGLRAAGYGENALVRAAMRPLRWVGQRTFDPLATKAVRQGIERAGGLVLGGDKFGEKGYLGGRDRAARRLEEVARAMAPTADQRQALTRNQQAEIGRQLAAAVTAQGNARQQVPRARAAAESDEHRNQERQRGTSRDTAQRNHDAADTRVRNSAAEIDAVRRETAEQIARAAPAAQARLRQAQDQQIEAINQRLQGERAALAQHQQTLREWDAAVTNASNVAEQRVMGTHNQRVADLTQEHAGVEQNVNERYGVRTIGRAIGRRQWSLYRQGTLDALGGAIHSHERDENIGATIRNLMRQQERGGGGAAGGQQQGGAAGTH